MALRAVDCRTKVIGFLSVNSRRMAHWKEHGTYCGYVPGFAAKEVSPSARPQLDRLDFG